MGSEDLRQKFQEFCNWMSSQGSSQGDRNYDRKPRGAVLEEKYFRRMDKYSGDPNKLRTWLFELLVAIGQVDRILGASLKKFLMKERGDAKPED